MAWLLFATTTLIIFVIVIEVYLVKQERHKLSQEMPQRSPITNQGTQTFHFTSTGSTRSNHQAVASSVTSSAPQMLQSALKENSSPTKNDIGKNKKCPSEMSAYEADADDILSRIFTIARPDTNNCLEVLMMLEQLAGKVKPEHLKKLKLLFNVYGSNNHLFDDGLVKVVATCCTCRAKFELLEHIFTESEFYTDVARSLELNSLLPAAQAKVELG